MGRPKDGGGDDGDDVAALRRLARALDELVQLDVVDVIEPTALKPLWPDRPELSDAPSQEPRKLN
jgi:hypothetical protein